MLAKEKVILLVEDTEEDVILTMQAFKRNKILNEVVVVRDGAQALDYIFCQGQYAGRDKTIMPAVVLLDLKLPKVDGLQVLQRLREDKSMRYLPVVVLTSSKEQEDLLNSYKLGANSYVRKPVDFDQFADAMQQLGMYWLLLNEPPPRGL